MRLDIPTLRTCDRKVLPLVIFENQAPPVEAGALADYHVILATGIVSNLISPVDEKVNDYVATVVEGSSGSIRWMNPTYLV